MAAHMLRYLLMFVWVATPAAACTGQTPCPLGDRSYHLREPDAWDGTSPLAVLLHFHGWKRQGTLIVQHGRIATGYVAENVLLLAPNGLGRTWDFWRAGSPDVAFARAVIEDAATRYPIDRSRIYISGYSWGANMAWRFVCEDGADVKALLAVAGTLDQDEPCTTHPRNVAQVYGLKDTVLPYPKGPDGDLTYPVALWRRALDCGTDINMSQWNARDFLPFSRRAWDCARGTVTLDTHPSGHFIPHDWLPLQVKALEGH